MKLLKILLLLLTVIECNALQQTRSQPTDAHHKNHTMIIAAASTAVVVTVLIAAMYTYHQNQTTIELQKQLDVAKANHTSATQTVTQLQQQLDTALKQHTSARDALAKIGTETAEKLQQQLDAAIKKCKTAETTIASLQQQIKSLKPDITAFTLLQLKERVSTLERAQNTPPQQEAAEKRRKEAEAAIAAAKKIADALPEKVKVWVGKGCPAEEVSQAALETRAYAQAAHTYFVKKIKEVATNVEVGSYRSEELPKINALTTHLKAIQTRCAEISEATKATFNADELYRQISVKHAQITIGYIQVELRKKVDHTTVKREASQLFISLHTSSGIKCLVDFDVLFEQQTRKFDKEQAAQAALVVSP